MTNAERQKAYRDRKRGGPPTGRWHNHTSVAKTAEAFNISRTMLFMGRWVAKHAPDVEPLLESGELKMKPTYDRLRREYVIGLARALQARPDGDVRELACTRQDGKFVFQWANERPKRRPRWKS